MSQRHDGMGGTWAFLIGRFTKEDVVTFSGISRVSDALIFLFVFTTFDNRIVATTLAEVLHDNCHQRQHLLEY
jgi:hypothetical protein